MSGSGDTVGPAGGGASEALAGVLADLAAGRLDWLLRAQDRCARDPDWVRSRDLLVAMASVDGRNGLASDLINEMVPRDVDPSIWAAWVSGESAPSMRLMGAEAAAGRRDASRDYEREVGQIDRRAGAGDRLREQAKALLEEAERHDREEARAQFRARRLLTTLMETAFYRCLSPVFAMGPAWSVMCACASVAARARLLQGLDAFFREPGFIEGLGEVIRIYVEGWWTKVQAKPTKRGERPWRSSTAYREKVQDGVSLGDVMTVLGKLAPGEDDREIGGAPRTRDGDLAFEDVALSRGVTGSDPRPVRPHYFDLVSAETAHWLPLNLVEDADETDVFGSDEIPVERAELGDKLPF